MDKPNCYECKFRGGLPGDDHSKCTHPKAMGDDPLGEILGLLASVQRVSPVTTSGAITLGIKGSTHGIRSGWFNWPFNFDPVWLEKCNGFEPKNREGVM